MAAKATKKPAARKAAAKTSAVKKAVAKKPAAKKTAGKKAPVKKTLAKKTLVNKTLTKKTSANKPIAKKAVVKKAAAKTPAKKLLATKPLAKATVKAPAARKQVSSAPKQTKTAERKAARAAKAALLQQATPEAEAKPAPQPVWPDSVRQVLAKLDEAKAEEIVTIDLRDKSTMADTMVVASGRSNRHVNAIADQVVEELKRQGLDNIRIEGVPQCDWVLVDAGDIVVHVFRPEVRSFYNLEKLWSANAPH